MPIPSLATLCINVQTADKLCITFPGGAEICAHVGLETGDPSTILRGLLAQVNAALIPLQPIFNIIDVVKAVGDCIGAIKDAFGPPPDPSGIAKCIPELFKRLAKLLKLLPQYSIPLLVKQLLTALVFFLQAVKLELQAILLQQARILAAATAANLPGNESLLAVVDCATGNLDTKMLNLGASFAPINSLLVIVNLLLGMIPGNKVEVPTFEDLGSDAQAALAPIDATIQVLQGIASKIPG